MSLSWLQSFRDITMYFSKFMRSRDSEHIPFGGNLLCVSIITWHLQCLASPIPKLRLRPRFKERAKWPGPRPLGGVVYHPKANTCIQKLANLASAVPVIWPRASKLKMDHHVTLATPPLGALCQSKVRTSYSLSVCKI